MRTHAHCDRIDAKSTEKTVESISTPGQNTPKSRRMDEVDGLGNIADGSIECRDMQNDEIDGKMLES